MKKNVLFFAATLTLSSLALTPLARGATADAREVARLNNCAPKKIEVYQQALGANGDTVYRVDCTMAKASGESGKNADALLIRCSGSLCEMLRPVASGGK